MRCRERPVRSAERWRRSGREGSTTRTRKQTPEVFRHPLERLAYHAPGQMNYFKSANVCSACARSFKHSYRLWLKSAGFTWTKYFSQFQTLYRMKTRMSGTKIQVNKCIKSYSCALILPIVDRITWLPKPDLFCLAPLPCFVVITWCSLLLHDVRTIYIQLYKLLAQSLNLMYVVNVKQK